MCVFLIELRFQIRIFYWSCGSGSGFVLADLDNLRPDPKIYIICPFLYSLSTVISHKAFVSSEMFDLEYSLDLLKCPAGHRCRSGLNSSKKNYYPVRFYLFIYYLFLFLRWSTGALVKYLILPIFVCILQYPYIRGWDPDCSERVGSGLLLEDRIRFV